MTEREDYNTILAALDRCEHGRHKADRCFSCPGEQSTGNLFLQPGQRIGTNLGGDPIIVPLDTEAWSDPRRWFTPAPERNSFV